MSKIIIQKQRFMINNSTVIGCRLSDCGRFIRGAPTQVTRIPLGLAYRRTDFRRVAYGLRFGIANGPSTALSLLITIGYI